MKKIYILITFMLTSLISFSQQNDLFCGFDYNSTNIIPQPLNNSNSKNSVNGVFYINVVFWQVFDDNGNLPAHYDNKSKVTFQRANELIKGMNSKFNPHNICFVLKEIKTINSSYSLTGNYYEYVFNNLWMNNHKDNEALNIYVVDNINLINGDPSIGGVAAFLGANRLLITDTEIALSPEKTTLEHEIGHCLGLRHTFSRSGLSNQPNSCERVTRDPLDPLYNADVAGDGIEDTNAILMLGKSNVDAVTCIYNGNPMINCHNESINVTQDDIKNIMNYCHICATDFTLGQRNLMHTTLLDSPQINNALNENYSGADLMMRNTEQDYGIVPDNASNYLWVSPDIWVRNNDDDGLEHQNPISNTKNYVYVRITNRSCESSTGTETLKLNWCKAGPNLPIGIWDGTIYMNGQPMGGLINELIIPTLNGNETTIVKFEWNAPNMINYEFYEEPWHYCLLGRINASTEIETLPITNGNDYLFRNSNNIVLKNVSLIKNSPLSHSGSIFVGNFKNFPTKIKIKFVKDYQEIGSSIFDEAEISLKLDSQIYSIWQNSNFTGTYVNRKGTTVRVKENSEIVLNNFPPDTFGLINAKINFLTQNSTEKNTFKFHIVQIDDENNIIGGEEYLVDKLPRDLFSAKISQQQNLLTAEYINENATYNWYNEIGDLLHTGQYYTVLNTKNETYKLEVIAFDGYKDYTNIELKDSDIRVSSINPNPAANQTLITFTKPTTSNMYLMLVDLNGSTVSNFIVPDNSSKFNLILPNIQNGIYKLVLVKNNQPIDFKNFIKN